MTENVLTDAERAIIDKHIEEIFEHAMVETIDCFMADSDFFDTLVDLAVENESSIEGARKLVLRDVCEGEQYFYTRIEEKLRNTVIIGVKFCTKKA